MMSGWSFSRDKAKRDEYERLMRQKKKTRAERALCFAPV